MPQSDSSLSPPYRFFADTMLGKLARWLRMLGYDTAYEKVMADDELIARALHEDRWLLTRDGYLARRRILRGRHSLIVSDHLDEQLRQLRAELSLRLDLTDRTSYRCAHCNTVLGSISAEEAAPFIPPYVAASYRDYLRCPGCARIYWPGTHWDHVLRRLASIRNGAARAAR